MRYKYFNSNMEREEVVKIGYNLARYLAKNKIENIIFLDRSARPGYIALKKAWKKEYPHIASPNVYFTNPEGYNTNNRNIKEIANEFNTIYTKLASNKGAKIMLFDVCMHSGNTVKPILDSLKEAGYNNIIVGLTQPKDSGYSCAQKVDFLALNQGSINICYPFMRDNIIEKNRTCIVSLKNKNHGDIEDSLNLRKEITSLF